MDGLLLIDKPAAWTSHDAVAYVRKTLGAKKAGHTGTLDPDATGLLVVLLGKATRLAPYLDRDEKEYTAEMRLGEETDTQDGGGKVIKECAVPDIGEREIKEVFRRFTGVIEQVPPMFSAVKVSGQPLYKKARAGTEVERAPRTVEIRELELLGVELPAVRFRAICSRGTYIRTLCRDIGEALGSCGHMASLRRTRAGEYAVADARSLSGRPSKDELAAAVTPIDKMLLFMPEVVVTKKDAEGVGFGRAPREDAIKDMARMLPEGQAVRLLDCSGRLLAVGVTAGGEVRLKVVLA